MNTLHADHHSVIGKAHLRKGTPCQDYALSGSFGDVHYAIVADGCSTGGQTDLGSRLVALATRQAIGELALNLDVLNNPNAAMRSIAAQQQTRLQTMIPLLGIETNDLLATCCSVIVTPTTAFAVMQGDGVLAYHTTDGERIVVAPEWSGNMPFYPAYRINQETMNAFLKESTGMQVTTTIGVAESVQPVAPHLGLDYLINLTTFRDKLTSVSVLTDGVKQMLHAQSQHMLPTLEVVDALLNYPTARAGRFVARRQNATLSDYAKQGYAPEDDLSGATILFS